VPVVVLSVWNDFLANDDDGIPIILHRPFAGIDHADQAARGPA
jgi:hypothetical protein